MRGMRHKEEKKVLVRRRILFYSRFFHINDATINTQPIMARAAPISISALSNDCEGKKLST